MLVIGGGDGGVVTELVKHPVREPLAFTWQRCNRTGSSRARAQNIRNITVVELDRLVVQTAKRFFPEVAAGFRCVRCAGPGG